jgi:hypothetical protein
MKLRTLFLLAYFFVGYASASYIGTIATTNIVSVSSYNQYGTGDVVFKVANPIAECSDGYWLAKSDVGFQANLAMIISAYQIKNPVLIYGLPDQLWSGSSGKYCKLYSVEFH